MQFLKSKINQHTTMRKTSFKQTKADFSLNCLRFLNRIEGSRAGNRGCTTSGKQFGWLGNFALPPVRVGSFAFPPGSGGNPCLPPSGANNEFGFASRAKGSEAKLPTKLFAGESKLGGKQGMSWLTFGSHKALPTSLVEATAKRTQAKLPGAFNFLGTKNLPPVVKQISQKSNKRIWLGQQSIQWSNFFISCKESRIETNRSFYGCFYLGPFESGESLTVANALRRTLLSELRGIAITAVEIEGALHEYSSLPGIRESVLDILLNFKEIVLKKKISNNSFSFVATEGFASEANPPVSFASEANPTSTAKRKGGGKQGLPPVAKPPTLANPPVASWAGLRSKPTLAWWRRPIQLTGSFSGVGLRSRPAKAKIGIKQVNPQEKKRFFSTKINWPQIGYLRARGPGIVKAKDLKFPSCIQCVDPEQYIATLCEDGFLNLKFMINEGKNYILKKSPSTFEAEKDQKKSELKNRRFFLKKIKVEKNLQNHPKELGKQQKLNNSNPLQVDAVFMPVTKVNYSIESNEQANDNIFPLLSLSKGRVGWLGSGPSFKSLPFAEQGLPPVANRREESKASKLEKKINASLKTKPLLRLQEVRVGSFASLPTNEVGKVAKPSVATKLASIPSGWNKARKKRLSTGGYASLAKQTFASEAKPTSLVGDKQRFASHPFATGGKQGFASLQSDQSLDDKGFLFIRKRIASFGTKPWKNTDVLKEKNKSKPLWSKKKMENLFLLSKARKHSFVAEPKQFETFKNNVILEIWTNGSIHPRQALYNALKYLLNLFFKLRKIKILGSMFNSDKTYNKLLNLSTLSSPKGAKSSPKKRKPYLVLDNKQKDRLSQNTKTKKFRRVSSLPLFAFPCLPPVAKGCEANPCLPPTNEVGFASLAKGSEAKLPTRTGGKAKLPTSLVGGKQALWRSPLVPEIKQNKYRSKNPLKLLDIGSLNISLRPYTCLKRANINTVAELLKYSKEELLLLKNFGKRSLQEVEQSLFYLSLSLKRKA